MNPVKGLFKSFLLNQVTVSIEGYRFRPKQFQIPTFLGLTFLRDTNQWIPLAFQATSHQVPGACCVLWCLNPPKEGILPSNKGHLGFRNLLLLMPHTIFFFDPCGASTILLPFLGHLFSCYMNRGSQATKVTLKHGIGRQVVAFALQQCHRGDTTLPKQRSFKEWFRFFLLQESMKNGEFSAEFWGNLDEFGTIQIHLNGPR